MKGQIQQGDVMLSRSQIKTLINSEPRFDDIACSLTATKKQPKSILKEAKEVIAIARKFNDEVARPLTLQLDQRMHEDPGYLAWDFVKEANKWGFYSLFIPKIFGGKGYSLSVIGYFIEELGSVCLALANLVNVHYLGYAGALSAWNLKLADRMSRDVVKGEKSGEPCLISFAMTEPDAGTDSQNVEFMDTGSLVCHAKRVKGGYLVNGAKCFISCGHLSTWHALFAYTDPKKGSENMVILAVKTGAKGFSFGKKEKKMGQKACPASELVFRDCFVPDDQVLLDKRHTSKLSKGPRHITELILAYIWAASRTGVAGFGVGVARGAFEQALQFASKTKVEEKLLINHEWCQSMLANMYTNVSVGRMAYMEAAYANGLYGVWKILNLKPMYYLTKLTPKFLIDTFYPFFLKLTLSTYLFQKISFDFQKDEQMDRTDGWGSLAKVVGTDAGIANCHMALEIMGQAGLRHDHRAEKMLRDSKLLQIYEGTNGINRVNLFKRLVARSCPDAKSFAVSST
jgi:alkylation response protein AidB-like acyl-CoA dehydrogenase